MDRRLLFVATLLICVAIAVGRAAGRQAAASTAISGRVIDGVTRQAMPGVAVNLRRISDMPVSLTQGCAVADVTFAVDQVVSDSSGAFTFEGVPSGVYVITSQAAGWSGGYYGQQTWDAPDRTIVVTERQRVAGLVVPIWPHAIITGRIVDDEDHPIAAVDVNAITTDSGAIAGDSQTDDRGRFVLDTLPGSYSIRALKAAVPDNDVVQRLKNRNGRQLTYRTTYFPGVTDVAAAAPLVVSAGDRRDGIDMVLRAEPGFRLTVTVSPAPTARWATVRLFDRGTQTRRFANLGETLPATFDRLPSGDYEIALHAGNQAGFGTVQVIDRDVTVAISLQQAPQLTGTVRFDGSGRSPSDSEIQRLIAGMANGPRCMTEDDNDKVLRAFLGPVSNGQFSSMALMPGRYQFGSVFVGDWRIASILLGGLDVTDRAFDLALGEPPAAVVTLTDCRARVTGRVTLDTRSEYVRPWVTVFPADVGRWPASDRQSQPAWYGRVGATGEYYVDLPEGDYWVVATDTNPAPLRSAAEFAALAARASSVTATKANAATRALQVQHIKTR